MNGGPPHKLDAFSFGDLLRQRRLAANLTQEGLAERAGLSVRGISDLERGERASPYRQTLLQLADALALTGAERAAFLRAGRRGRRPAPHAGRRGGAAGLPVHLTRLIGRREELTAVTALLRDEATQLITLTGAGGVGKTRLALAVAEDLSDAFANGVAFVDLSPLRDPAHVPARIATSLGLHHQEATPTVDLLRRFLAARQLLLVLDNFEHVLQAATVVHDVLRRSPAVKALVTSREALRLLGEREYVVAPLRLPDLSPGTPLAEVAECAAVQLFVERAVAVQSDFRLTPENSIATAAICHRLDGLPLAIELAAPRIKVLPPDVLLQRLESRLALLTSAPRDAPARQRTLRDAIAWSYDLLAPDEQRFLRRLGVFVGGWTLAAAEAVAGADGDLSVLDGLTSLVDKSLVRVDNTGPAPRYGLLETIREFACESLRAVAGKEQSVRLAHAEFYRALALDASDALVGSQQEAWLARLDAEEPNIHAALAWTLDHGTAESALQCASALWRYWSARGRLVEGKQWLERALSRADARSAQPLTRANAHNALGNLLGDIGEYAFARQHLEAALALRRSLHDDAGIAGALNNLGLIAAWLGDYQAALDLHTESLEIRRTLVDHFGLALSLSNLGDVMLAQGDFDRARELQREALRLREDVQDAAGSAYTLYNLGEVARLSGDLVAAGRHLYECLRRFDTLGDKIGMAYAACSLGELASREGDTARAATLIHRALRTRAEIGDKRGVIECLEALGLAAIRERSYRAGLHLLAAAQSLREAISCPLPPVSQETLVRELAAVRRELGASAVDELLQDRPAIALDQAVALAHETIADLGGTASEPPPMS